MNEMKRGTLRVDSRLLEHADEAWREVMGGGEGWACCTSQVFGWRKLKIEEVTARGTLLSAETWREGVSRHLRYDDGDGVWRLLEYTWDEGGGEMWWEQRQYVTTAQDRWLCASSAPTRMNYRLWWSRQPDPIEPDIKVLRPHAGVFMGWHHA